MAQIIKVLESEHIFEVSKPEEVRLQIVDIYFLYKHNLRVARKLETRVVGLIAHFFIIRDSISL